MVTLRVSSNHIRNRMLLGASRALVWKKNVILLVQMKKLRPETDIGWALAQQPSQVSGTAGYG